MKYAYVDEYGAYGFLSSQIRDAQHTIWIPFLT